MRSGAVLRGEIHPTNGGQFAELFEVRDELPSELVFSHLTEACVPHLDNYRVYSLFFCVNRSKDLSDINSIQHHHIDKC